MSVQIFKQSGVEMMASPDQDASSLIESLVEYLHSAERDLEQTAEQKRVKLQQCVQLRHLENEVRQVNVWIRNSEAMIAAGLVCPASLPEAEQLRKEHEQFQLAIEVFILLPVFNILRRIYDVKKQLNNWQLSRE